ncbi:hypothetical protein DAEQUDRAFT_723666 [Daedalea quercina L-15889]|uniref:Uncharacterized protein n=1 Tax=Daedalea quercina L-15889 TaxID=1314783 RepID=A0A165SHV0_9APHY|nr:hypothetical protein DAEQUDRAFT_723666 [Daedalea quercina L-15889]
MHPTSNLVVALVMQLFMIISCHLRWLEDLPASRHTSFPRAATTHNATQANWDGWTPQVMKCCGGLGWTGLGWAGCWAAS